MTTLSGRTCLIICFCFGAHVAKLAVGVAARAVLIARSRSGYR